MQISKRQWVVAVLVALYMYFLLPLTAEMFYELHHMTGIDTIYWGYSGFKAAGYYLGVYEYRFLLCLSVAAAILIIPSLFRMFRRS